LLFVLLLKEIESVLTNSASETRDLVASLHTGEAKSFVVKEKRVVMKVDRMESFVVVEMISKIVFIGSGLWRVVKRR
jgi:hypothetical protein